MLGRVRGGRSDQLGDGRHDAVLPELLPAGQQRSGRPDGGVGRPRQAAGDRGDTGGGGDSPGPGLLLEGLLHTWRRHISDHLSAWEGDGRPDVLRRVSGRHGSLWLRLPQRVPVWHARRRAVLPQTGVRPRGWLRHPRVGLVHWSGALRQRHREMRGSGGHAVRDEPRDGLPEMRGRLR